MLRGGKDIPPPALSTACRSPPRATVDPTFISRIVDRVHSHLQDWRLPAALSTTLECHSSISGAIPLMRERGSVPALLPAPALQGHLAVTVPCPISPRPHCPLQGAHPAQHSSAKPPPTQRHRPYPPRVTGTERDRTGKEGLHGNPSMALNPVHGTGSRSHNHRG